MACTTLTVKEAPFETHIIDIKYGFAEIEYVNRMFDEPCEEDDIIGSREAIGLIFTVTGAPLTGASFRFTVNYLRPGDTVKISWSADFTMTDGTYTRYIYSDTLKYIRGQYTGLTLGIVFLK